jgi:hypothetical protein
MGFMSKRLLYTKNLTIYLGATHLPGRACATTLACGAAIFPRLQIHSLNNGVFEISSNLVRSDYVE